MQREIQNLESRLGSQGNFVSSTKRDAVGLDDDMLLDEPCDSSSPGTQARIDETNLPESFATNVASQSTASQMNEMRMQKEETAAIFLLYAGIHQSILKFQ